MPPGPDVDDCANTPDAENGRAKTRKTANVDLVQNICDPLDFGKMT